MIRDPESDGIFVNITRQNIAALQERLAYISKKFNAEYDARLAAQAAHTAELAQARAVIEAQAWNLEELRGALSAMLDFTVSESTYGYRDRAASIRQAQAALEGVEPDEQQAAARDNPGAPGELWCRFCQQMRSYKQEERDEVCCDICEICGNPI